MSMSRALLTSLLSLFLLAPSCRLFRRSQPPPPPPTPLPKPAPLPPPAEPAPAEPKPLPTPPKVDKPSVGTLPKPPVATQPELSVPTRPPQSRRPRTTPPRQPGAEAPVPKEQPPADQHSPVPRLTQLLTPEEERALNRILDETIARTQRTVSTIDVRKLNREQTAVLNRVRTFLQQAVDARKMDLITARSLAERADILARDLARSLQ